MNLKETIRVLKYEIKEQKKHNKALKADGEEVHKQLHYQHAQWATQEKELKLALQTAVAAAASGSSSGPFGSADTLPTATGSGNANALSSGISNGIAGNVTQPTDSSANSTCVSASTQAQSLDAVAEQISLNTPALPKPIPKCLLSDIEDVELLHVFSFLITSEVLTTATVGRFIFQRVDGLFGLDSKVTEESWAERYPKSVSSDSSSDSGTGAGDDDVGSTLPDPAAGTTTAPLTDAAVAVASFEAALLALKTGNRGSRRTHATYDEMCKERGRLEMALAAAKRELEEEEAVKNSSSSSSSGGGGGGGGFFSSFTSSIANSIRPAVLDDIDEETGILPESVLSLIRAKLSNAEMSAVGHLNKCSILIHNAQQEKQLEMDDVNAKLLSTESVRDFLVAKLKEAETALKGALKDANRLRRQAQSDAEVISFLDLQGLDNEGKIQQLEHTCHTLQATLNLHLGNHSQIMKTREEDFLALQAKYEELEATSKASKKILVKEVKTLRNALDGVTSERDVLKAQIQVIKNSLLLSACSGTRNSGSGSGSGSNSNSSGGGLDKSIANSTSASKVSKLAGVAASSGSGSGSGSGVSASKVHKKSSP